MKTKNDTLPLRPARVLRALLLGLALAGFTSVRAQLTMTLPAVQLEPNSAGQVFDVYISNTGGAQAVTGMDVNIQVADGGTLAGGSINGPAITGVDIFTGTIFASNNTGVHGSLQIVPQVFEIGTTTDTKVSATVNIPADSPSLIATVTVDTTGFFSGSWAITLNSLNGPTKFTTAITDPVYNGNDILLTLANGGVVDGTITISPVPEPGAYALLAGVACVVFAGARRCKSRTANRAAMGI